jgi:hypothetical protein
VSFYDYRQSLEISATDPPFASLIMSALRIADMNNLAKLKHAFPDIYAEFIIRYYSPGGYKEGEGHGTSTTDRPTDIGHDRQGR